MITKNHMTIIGSHMTFKEVGLHGLHECLEVVFYIVHYDVYLVHVIAHNNLLRV